MSISRGPSVVGGGDGNPIGAIVGLAAIGVSIWGLVCAAGVTIAAMSLLLRGLSQGIGATIVTNVILGGIAGLFAAVATEIVRQGSRRAAKHGGHFISSLFQRRLGESTLDTVFWSRVVIGGLIGLATGFLNGSTGMLSPLQFLWGTAEATINESAYPVVVLVGGGFGGPGGVGFLSLAFLVLVIILSAIIAALLAGLLLHLLMYAIAGMSKGATKAYITNILHDQSAANHGDDQHPVLTGMTRGFFIGLVVGAIESVFTILGIIKFYPT